VTADLTELPEADQLQDSTVVADVAVVVVDVAEHDYKGLPHTFSPFRRSSSS
jgi:hypothetical protein